MKLQLGTPNSSSVFQPGLNHWQSTGCGGAKHHRNNNSRQGAVANATYVDTTQDALAQAQAPPSATASQPLYSADAIATAPQPEDQEAYDLGHAETGDQTYDLGNSNAPQGATKSVTRYDYDTDDLSEEEI